MVEMSLAVGDGNTEPLEIAVLVNSIAGLTRWVFFIFVAYICYKSIKKKNADHGDDKHS